MKTAQRKADCKGGGGGQGGHRKLISELEKRVGREHTGTRQ